MAAITLCCKGGPSHPKGTPHSSTQEVYCSVCFDLVVLRCLQDCRHIIFAVKHANSNKGAYFRGCSSNFYRHTTTLLLSVLQCKLTVKKPYSPVYPSQIRCGVCLGWGHCYSTAIKHGAYLLACASLSILSTPRFALPRAMHISRTAPACAPMRTMLVSCRHVADNLDNAAHCFAVAR